MYVESVIDARVGEVVEQRIRVTVRDQMSAAACVNSVDAVCVNEAVCGECVKGSDGTKA